MKNPKAKGGGWERTCAVLLSKWITSGKQSDCFWRSAMSGGRATVARAKGVNVRQSGDICAVSPEGHALCNDLYMECKFLKECSIDSALEGGSALRKIWDIASVESQKTLKFPVLLIKRNRRKPLWITCATVAKMLSVAPRGSLRVDSRTVFYGRDMHIFLLDDVLKSTPPKSWTKSK